MQVLQEGEQGVELLELEEELQVVVEAVEVHDLQLGPFLVDHLQVVVVEVDELEEDS